MGDMMSDYDRKCPECGHNTLSIVHAYADGRPDHYSWLCCQCRARFALLMGPRIDAEGKAASPPPPEGGR